MRRDGLTMLDSDDDSLQAYCRGLSSLSPQVVSSNFKPLLKHGLEQILSPQFL
ncbi:hypothetical protein PPL_02078 [Heterostelium album PN500]|uniref:Uncharacterized protein n=1 Tax=Heterostelium pallidum (strain ATCC 26659 / Pp 5 / PN500) TaxID=670386 RepID=D3B1A7_HETP5|nr:hypothetical protein PPL_02078 [Heterostelium album PN500]EFA85081.1 hypothetical protein PPL_02078 [Heterostelium album PN500]|eukprot:XP_020437191.1 hypothetical protein PPL_02078 [Heterostelium album PN500]